MLSDAITSVKAYLYDRAVSPLMGSFIVSWMIWNYKFLLVLIAPISVYEKLWMFENAFFQDFHSAFGVGLILPLFTALVYLFIFPYPAKWVYKFWLKQQNIMTSLKQKLNENRLLSLVESREILNKVNDLESDFTLRLEEKNKLISNLKKSNQMLEYKKDLIENLSKTKIEILNLLNNHNDSLDYETVLKYMTDDDYDLKNNVLEELRYSHLVESLPNGNYRITTKGKNLISAYNNKVKNS